MSHRVLFVAEAVTLAHVARAVALATSAQTHQHEVAVACAPSYRWVVEQANLDWRSVHTIETEQFEQAMRTGTPIYRTTDLLAYAEEEATLLKAFAPDVVVGDFRLSLPASAKLQGIPSVNVVNAYWSPEGPRPSEIPDVPAKRWLGRSLGRRAFGALYPLISRQHAAPVVAFYRELGLGPIPPDLQHAYSQGDCLAYPDMPHLYPTMTTGHFLGPVHWQPRRPLPDALSARTLSDKPLIYLNLGSSGQAALVPKVLQALAGMDILVVAATAGKAQRHEPPTVDAPQTLWLNYAPGAALAAIASVVICNGGSLGCHQALAQGTPVLALPSNLDQCLNAQALERTDAIRVERTGWGWRQRVRAAVEELLNSPQRRRAAAAVAHLASGTGLATRLEQALDRACSSTRTALHPGSAHKHYEGSAH